MKKVILIFAIVFLVVACGDDVNRIVRKAYYVSANLPDSLKVNEDYIMPIYYTMPNPCYKFSDLEYKRTDNIHYFTVWIINENASSQCPQELVTDSLTRVINLSDKGRHTFKFDAFEQWESKDVVVY